MLGYGPGRRQYVGSTVRMLAETEGSAKVWLYRVVVFLQNLVLWTLRRPEALRGLDLWKALSGDPGPLPSQPTRSRE